MSKRVGVYVRISTQDQNSDMQRDELLSFCKLRDWAVVAVFEDKMSGTLANRPEFQNLLRLCRRRGVDALICWKMDRCFRSLQNAVNTLQELTDLGVEFVSLRDQIDMSTAGGRLMIHLLAAFGEFEAALCRERVRAGLDAARRRGKKLGRPPSVNSAKIRELRRAGRTYRQIVDILNVSPGSIALAVKKMG